MTYVGKDRLCSFLTETGGRRRDSAVFLLFRYFSVNAELHKNDLKTSVDEYPFHCVFRFSCLSMDRDRMGEEVQRNAEKCSLSEKYAEAEREGHCQTDRQSDNRQLLGQTWRMVLTQVSVQYEIKA